MGGPSTGQPAESSDVYYDESYYDVPIQQQAGRMLADDFNRVNGGGMNG